MLNSPRRRFGHETRVPHAPDIPIAGLDSETSHCVKCAAQNGEPALVGKEATSQFVRQAQTPFQRKIDTVSLAFFQPNFLCRKS